MRISTITNWAYGLTLLLTGLSGAARLAAAQAAGLERAAVEQHLTFDTLAEDAFLSPAHRGLRAAIAAAGGDANAAGGPAWIDASEPQLSEERLRSGVHGLAVEPLRTGAEAQERYADSMLARMHQIVTARQMATLKSRLQRINPLESAEEHARLFGQLISLESYHRALLERAIGDH